MWARVAVGRCGVGRYSEIYIKFEKIYRRIKVYLVERDLRRFAERDKGILGQTRDTRVHLRRFAEGAKRLSAHPSPLHSSAARWSMPQMCGT